MYGIICVSMFWVCVGVSMRRSARRAIVRAICAYADVCVPPGSMNWLCAGSVFSMRSISVSRCVVCCVANGCGCHLLSGSVASAAPMSKSLCCMFCNASFVIVFHM